MTSDVLSVPPIPNVAFLDHLTENNILDESPYENGEIVRRILQKKNSFSKCLVSIHEESNNNNENTNENVNLNDNKKYDNENIYENVDNLLNGCVIPNEELVKDTLSCRLNNHSLKNRSEVKRSHTFTSTLSFTIGKPDIRKISPDNSLKKDLGFHLVSHDQKRLEENENVLNKENVISNGNLNKKENAIDEIKNLDSNIVGQDGPHSLPESTTDDSYKSSYAKSLMDSYRKTVVDNSPPFVEKSPQFVDNSGHFDHSKDKWGKSDHWRNSGQSESDTSSPTQTSISPTDFESPREETKQLSYYGFAQDNYNQTSNLIPSKLSLSPRNVSSALERRVASLTDCLLDKETEVHTLRTQLRKLSSECNRLKAENRNLRNEKLEQLILSGGVHGRNPQGPNLGAFGEHDPEALEKQALALKQHLDKAKISGRELNRLLTSLEPMTSSSHVTSQNGFVPTDRLLSNRYTNRPTPAEAMTSEQLEARIREILEKDKAREKEREDKKYKELRNKKKSKSHLNLSSLMDSSFPAPNFRREISNSHSELHHHHVTQINPGFPNLTKNANLKNFSDLNTDLMDKKKVPPWWCQLQRSESVNSVVPNRTHRRVTRAVSSHHVVAESGGESCADYCADSTPRRSLAQAKHKSFFSSVRNLFKHEPSVSSNPSATCSECGSKHSKVVRRQSLLSHSPNANCSDCLTAKCSNTTLSSDCVGVQGVLDKRSDTDLDTSVEASDAYKEEVDSVVDRNRTSVLCSETPVQAVDAFKGEVDSVADGNRSVSNSETPVQAIDAYKGEVDSVVDRNQSISCTDTPTKVSDSCSGNSESLINNKYATKTVLGCDSAVGVLDLPACLDNITVKKRNGDKGEIEQMSKKGGKKEKKKKKRRSIFYVDVEKEILDKWGNEETDKNKKNNKDMDKENSVNLNESFNSIKKSILNDSISSKVKIDGDSNASIVSITNSPESNNSKIEFEANNLNIGQFDWTSDSNLLSNSHQNPSDLVLWGQASGPKEISLQKLAENYGDPIENCSPITRF